MPVFVKVRHLPPVRVTTRDHEHTGMQGGHEILFAEQAYTPPTNIVSRCCCLPHLCTASMEADLGSTRMASTTETSRPSAMPPARVSSM